MHTHNYKGKRRAEEKLMVSGISERQKFHNGLTYEGV